MSDIKICKLVDGSMVVGRDTKDYLCDIVSISVDMRNEKLAIGLIPYMFPFDQRFVGINVQSSKIVTMIEASEDLVNEYCKLTSSILPATSIPSHLGGKVVSMKR